MARNSFSINEYVSFGDYVEIDIDYNQALEAIPREYILEWLGEEARGGALEAGYDLSDPVVRLEVITELRKEYTIEPR